MMEWFFFLQCEAMRLLFYIYIKVAFQVDFFKDKNLIELEKSFQIQNPYAYPR